MDLIDPHALNRLADILLEVLPRSPQTRIFLGIHLLICAAALVFGRAAERIVAVALTVGFAAVLSNRLWSPAGPTLTMLVIELAMLALVAGLIAVNDRRWLLFVAAFELLLILCHVAVMAKPHIQWITYMDALATLSYGVLLALAAGTWGVWRERRAGK